MRQAHLVVTSRCVTDPPWKAYEQQIFDRLKQGIASEAEVTFDSNGRQRLTGRYSKTPRQVDVLVRGRLASIGKDRMMVVDCKHWTGKVDVVAVDAFVGFLLDVGVPLGLLVTTGGFTRAAKDRALGQGSPDVDLDVVPFDDLAAWRPRNVTVATTAGTNTATFTYRGDDGRLRTEVVDPDLARRLSDERRRETGS